jgi:hypothetical protein
LKTKPQLFYLISQFCIHYSFSPAELEPSSREILNEIAQWMAVDQYDPPNQGKTITETDCKSVVIDLWTDEELHALADGQRKSDLLPRRTAREDQARKGFST